MDQRRDYFTCGAEGTHLAQQHVAHLLDTLRAMRFGPGYIVYISPLIVPETSPYSLQLSVAGGVTLDASAISIQPEAIKTGAKALCAQGDRVALYTWKNVSTEGQIYATAYSDGAQRVRVPARSLRRGSCSRAADPVGDRLY